MVTVSSRHGKIKKNSASVLIQARSRILQYKLNNSSGLHEEGEVFRIFGRPRTMGIIIGTRRLLGFIVHRIYGGFIRCSLTACCCFPELHPCDACRRTFCSSELHQLVWEI